jgi:hypothetical protein
VVASLTSGLLSTLRGTFTADNLTTVAARILAMAVAVAFVVYLERAARARSLTEA